MRLGQLLSNYMYTESSVFVVDYSQISASAFVIQVPNDSCVIASKLLIKILVEYWFFRWNACCTNFDLLAFGNVYSDARIFNITA